MVEWKPQALEGADEMTNMLPIVEALLSEDEDENGDLVPLNRHGEKAAEIIEELVKTLGEIVDAHDTLERGEQIPSYLIEAGRRALSQAKS